MQIIEVFLISKAFQNWEILKFSMIRWLQDNICQKLFFHLHFYDYTNIDSDMSNHFSDKRKVYLERDMINT